uniref:F-box domain-containing protein n=1 Tax=Kalanchoe fedtschenkoi TaxID=63787 RepID=A0A7N0UJ90_KALFE
MTAPELGAERELCGDLIREILLKLPVKSLLRFKQVSKTWLQMITSTSFISSHYSVAKNRQPGPPFFSIRNELAALWNPGTRKLEAVPPDRIHEEHSWMFGFGHVDYKDDRFSYKVGLLSPPKNNVAYWLQLYSSGSDSWKVLMTPDGSRCCSWTGRGVNLNGKYHTLFVDPNKKPEEGNGYKHDFHIMTFDYDNAVFGRMEVPKVLPITGRWNLMFKSFLTLDGDKCLCLVIRWKNAEVNHEGFMDVWVMSKYGVKESWSKKGTTGRIFLQLSFPRIVFLQLCIICS